MHVAGLGFWSRGVPNAQALLTGQTDPEVREPLCTLLAPRLARRASLLTRMMLEVAGQAGQEAGVDLALVPSIFGTARGELETVHALLDQLTQDGQLSPARFHNSVYNAASGYFSIAAGNPAFTTTLAVGHETLPLVLLEAMCVLAERPGAVLAVVGEEAMTIPFLRSGDEVPLAAALCLTSEPPPRGSLGLLSAPQRTPAEGRPFEAASLAGLRPFLTRLLARKPGTVQLSDTPDETAWAIELQFT